MEWLEYIQCGTLIFLTGVLFLLVTRRDRKPLAAARWTGHGIDAASAVTRVQQLRSEFPEIAHQHAHVTCRHQLKVLAARRALCRLSYFRHREPAPVCVAASEEISETRSS